MVTLRSVTMLSCAFGPPLLKNSGSAPGGPIQQWCLVVENFFGFNMKHGADPSKNQNHKTSHKSKHKNAENCIYLKMSDNVLFFYQNSIFLDKTRNS